MPENRFPTIGPRLGVLPDTLPTPTVTAESQGLGIARGLAALGSALTDLGKQRVEAETRLARLNAVTEHETAFGEEIAAWKQNLARATDPAAIRASEAEFFRDLDERLDTIEDGVVRETVRKQVASWTLEAKNAAGARTWALEVGRAQAAGDAKLSHLERLAVDADNPVAQVFAETELRTHVEQLVQTGVRTPQWAQARLEAAQTTIARGRAAVLAEADPEAAVRAFSDPAHPISAGLSPTERIGFKDLAERKAKEGREGFIRSESLRLAAPLEDQVQAGHLVTLEGLTEAAQAAATRAATGDAEVDAALVDATVSRGEAIWARHQESERQRRAAKAFEYYAMVETTKTTDGIPAADWVDLEPGQRAGLRALEAALQKGETPETDWSVYYDLKTQASTPALRDTFLQTDLLATHGRALAPAELKELIGVQARLRDGEGDAALEGYRTAKQAVDDLLAAVGLDPTPRPGSDVARQVAEFRRQVDVEVAEERAKTGRKPTATEVEKIASRLLVKGRVPGTGLPFVGWFGRTPRRFELRPGEAFVVEDVRQVPASERSLIEDALRRRRMPVTDENVLGLYNAVVTEERAGGR